MPKVTEVLVRNECHGQVWFSTQPVDVGQEVNDLPNPRQMEKGIRASPWKKDNFPNQETE